MIGIECLAANRFPNILSLVTIDARILEGFKSKIPCASAQGILVKFRKEVDFTTPIMVWKIPLEPRTDIMSAIDTKKQGGT